MAEDRRVALVGKAPASIPRTPFDDEDVEIWSLSDNYRNLPRWDRWFELHDVDYHREHHPDHWEFLLQDHGKPLYLLGPHAAIPHATVYPRDEVLQRFPPGYFTNSISYMIALAIMEGFTEIGIYGVDMAQHDEYAHQRPSCEWMIGFAQGMGIKVVVPEESDLLKCRKLYGYETHNGDMYHKCRARIAELEGRIGDLSKSKEDSDQQCQVYYGALQEVQLMLQSNGEYSPTSRLTELQARVNLLASERDQADKQMLIMQGALEQMHWTRQWC